MRSLLLIVVAFAAGCASTTVINTQPPGAMVIMDGATWGQTPYAFTETVSVFTKHVVTLHRDGFQDLTAVIAADQWQTGKVVLSILCFWPGLFFSTEYAPAYNFTMMPAGPMMMPPPPGGQPPPPPISEKMLRLYDPDNLITVR